MNKKISSLGSLGGTPDVADIIPITDVSDTTGSVNGTTKKVTVANLVAAAPQGDLVASNNLSDVASAGTARTNLGLGTAATTASSDYATAAQGALADSATQPSDIGTAASQDVGTSASNVVQLDGTAKLPAVDGSQLTNLPAASITDENLRGTDNPHIGAFPNQSFLVVDNPSKSVMLASDADGTLNIINSLGKFAITVGLSVSEDSLEPDIEITTTSGTYSVISGDSDALGSNGLPIRQGFNTPDIGANPAPLLISGGTIS